MKLRAVWGRCYLHIQGMEDPARISSKSSAFGSIICPSHLASGPLEINQPFACPVQFQQSSNPFGPGSQTLVLL